VERLSLGAADLAAHYEVVVVGSGYGGAIAACRLSRAGRSVALLERGRELHPGEYPSRLHEAAARMQATGPGPGPIDQVGDPRNLYWLHRAGDVNVLTGCGLGGTSLVNAGVSLEPDPDVLDDPRWPTALRVGGRRTLDDGFRAARHMLAPEPYPDDHPRLAKTAALQLAAGARVVARTPVNVTFRSGTNAAGVHQSACVGCGDCVTGCNFGAKNTVLMNYLPDAHAHGARIFTELDVRHVEPGPEGTGWIVRARPLGRGRDFASHDATIAVAADVVVLAAGTMGTAGILLRSRARGLPMSDQVGHHFTGNGDVLGFSQRRRTVVHGIGSGARTPEPSAPAGPCITSMIDHRDEPAGDGVVIEDAVIPGLLAEIVAAELATQFGARGESGPERLRAGLAAVASFLQGGRTGATEHLQPLLLMGRDDGRGRLVLRGDHVGIEWPGVGSSDYLRRATATLERAARRGGGTFVADPFSSGLFHDSPLTVHPLGGCIMADDAGRGVVDHRGRVFSGATGHRVHEDLIVTDGSIVPLPLGVNPLLTISALAERSMAILCAERGWSPGAPRTGPSPAPARSGGVPTGPGLRFTERMAGWWAEGPPDGGGALAPYLDAASRGERTGTGRLEFVLTLTSTEIDRVIARTDVPMEATGTVTAPRLSPTPLTVDGGTFLLLVSDDPDPAVRHMRYRLPLVAASGERYFLDGFKTVAPGALDELWGATTTLYVTLHATDSSGPVLGRGVLRLTPRDFARQLRTVEVTGPVGTAERLRIESGFARAFAGPLAHDYGSAVHRTTSFNPAGTPRRRRELDAPEPEIHGYRTPDGLDLRLTRYRGGTSGPVLLSHGMGNRLTWSLDTVDVTLVEFLVAHGYDVWLQDWRSSTLLDTSLTQFNGDQVARHDHPSAAAAVARLSGKDELHVVAHCVGSITWVMSTLAGHVDPTSLFCSAAAAHPIAPALTRMKVGFRLGEILHRLGVRILTTDSDTGESWSERLMDQVLRLYPLPGDEECDQAVCRRVAFIYGNAVRHANINPATHEALHELFGPTNLTMMDHLSTMARARAVRTVTGADRYLPHLERLRRPVTVASGDNNRVWLPASTARTYDLLVDRFGPGPFRRIVYEGYGHQDVFNGATAVRDTFPSVVEHLRRAGA